MQLELLDELFSVCKVARVEQIPFQEEFVFVGKTDGELSLVCRATAVPEGCTEEAPGWRCFRVKGPLDFSLIGILSRLSSVLAQEKISVFAVSTFDTDYLLVREEALPRAKAALERAGYDFV